jgi:hypothetical protein
MHSLSHSVRRFVLALGLASMVATVHGAWFAVSDAAGTSMAVARVRVSVWDVYEQKWASQYLVQGQAFKGAEGDIIELRPETAGASIASAPAFLETISLNTPPASACPTLTQACTIPAPNPTGAALAAAGTPLYLRLMLSQPVYGPGAANPGAPATAVATPTMDDLQAVDTQGSVGVHAVTLNVGADAVSFNWDVTRWAKGDVFVGLNGSSYKVIDRHGTFKRFLGSAEVGRVDQYGDPTGPTTTGCAANWHTGEVHLTNFGGIDPAINVVTRQPGAGTLPYSDASRRLSTAIFRSDDEAQRTSTDPDRPWVYPIDLNPESLVFDANQNMLVGHSFGHYMTGDEFLVDANYLPIENFTQVVDELGNVVMTRAMGSSDPWTEAYDGYTSNRLAHDANGALTFVERTYTWGSGPGESALLRLPTAYWESDSGAWLEAQNNPGNPIPVRQPLGKRLHRYNNQGTPAAPVYSAASRDIFWTFVSRQGTDWIDISSDQSTIYYTSENAYIHRYNTTTGEQLPDLGTGQYRRIGGAERFNALRILPPGDGTGGLIVAAGSAVLRLDQDGAIVQRYQAVFDPDVIAYANYSGNGLVQRWYTIEIDPGGRTFWAGARDSGMLYRFDLASGQILQTIRAVDYRPYGSNDAPEGREINGICIMWEYTAAQEVCDDGNDNDNDGFIDESCTAIESCSLQSPGDDDGDGFSDHNDTDCGAELPPTAGDDQYVINQGDSLTVPANGVMSNDSDPDNLDGDAANNDPVVVSQTGANQGSLAASNVGAVITTTQGGTATLAANGSLMYTPAAGFHGLDTLVYQVSDGATDSNMATVTIRVRPRVANDSYTMAQNSTLSVGGLDASPAGILVNDSSQPMQVTGAGPAAPTAFTGSRTFTTPTGAQVTIAENGNFTYVPLPSFTGVDSFVYSGHDGTSAAVNTAVVTITVVDINELVAVNDGIYSTAYETAIVRNLRANDSDPEGHSFQIIAINGQAIAVGGTVTITGGTVELLDVTGNVRMTPATGFTGLLTFTYTIQDAPPTPVAPVTATAEVRLEVAAPPVRGFDDIYTTQQNTTLTIAAPGVLSNDQGSGTLKVYSAGLAPNLVPSVLGQPIVGVTGHVGTFTLSVNGALIYTPRLNFVGRDSFKYNLKDSTGQVSNWIDVFIDVTPLSSTEVTTPSPTTYGSGATITATVTCGSNMTPSVGTVTFRQGATVIASGVPVVNGVATAAWPASSPVNTYTVVAEYSGAPLNCPGSSDDTQHQVNRAPLTVRADAQQKVYGTVFTFNGTEFTTSGLLFNDSVTSATLVSAGTPAAATVAGSPYTITPSAAVGTGLSNYTITYATGQLTVTPKALTVTADSLSKVYGTLTTFNGTEFSVVGLVNGNTVSTVSLSSTGAPASTPANTSYPIVPSAAVGTGLGNYAITYVNGTLTVSSRVLTLTARNQTKTYGETFSFAGTEFTMAGLQSGDSVTSVSLSSAGAANTASVAGSAYTIGISNAVGSGLENYSITYVTGLLTVNRAPLTVRADAQTKPYGMTFSFDGNEFTTTGLLFPTDTVTGVTLNSAGSAPTASVAGSSYAIVPSAATGTGLGNYTITYVNGAMTVTAIPLTITASDRTKTYGTAVTFAGSEFSTLGLVNGDAVNSVSLSSTGAPASAPANTTYPIVVSAASGPALGNYDIRYVNGTLTVDRKSATVTAGSGTKIIGASDPTLTTSQTGFLASDLSSITLETTRVAGETVNTYPTTATATGAPISNYDVTYNGGTFTITNRAPVAQNDAAATTATIPVTIAVLGNDSDPDGHTITIESFTQPSGGTVTQVGNTFTFVANFGFFGPTTFTYTITDGYGLTSTATVTVTVQSAGGAYRTQTQGGWGTSPSGDNPGALLESKFAQVFTSGYVQVGGTFTLKFTSAANVRAFLPAGGKAKKLTASDTNPTTSKAGVFAGQVLALQISVSFSNAGVTRYGLASLKVQSGKLAGYTVAQVLALANSVLGGGALPSGLTLTELNDIVDKINNNFVDGTTDLGYLR